MAWPLERSSDVTKALPMFVERHFSTFSPFAIVSPVVVAVEASNSLLNGIVAAAVVDERAEDFSLTWASDRRRAICAVHCSPVTPAVEKVSWRNCAFEVSTICFSVWRCSED